MTVDEDFDADDEADDNTDDDFDDDAEDNVDEDVSFVLSLEDTGTDDVVDLALSDDEEEDFIDFVDFTVCLDDANFEIFVVDFSVDFDVDFGIDFSTCDVVRLDFDVASFVDGADDVAVDDGILLFVSVIFVVDFTVTFDFGDKKFVILG